MRLFGPLFCVALTFTVALAIVVAAQAVLA